MGRESGIPFGAYRLERRLARGGMAEVFLARQRGPAGWGRPVALKRILPHLVEDESFVRMFLDEARLAARLSHPNIVHIYELGEAEGAYYIAMEYVHGVDVATLFRRHDLQPLPPELIARLGADAAAGLHHAHTFADADGTPLGIVHRDVSPQNLLVATTGVVKLVDFGIAKAAFQSDETRPGVVKGKFAYMSPEQVIAQPLDGRSDVFALGIVLWELLAGRVAVPRADPIEGMRMVRDGRIPPIETIRPDTPPELAHALGRALARRRDERPTAAELGFELETYLKHSEYVVSALAVSDWLRTRFPTLGAHPPAAPAGDTTPALGTAPLGEREPESRSVASLDVIDVEQDPTEAGDLIGSMDEASAPPTLATPSPTASASSAPTRVTASVVVAIALAAIVAASAVAFFPRGSDETLLAATGGIIVDAADTPVDAAAAVTAPVIDAARATAPVIDAARATAPVADAARATAPVADAAADPTPVAKPTPRRPPLRPTTPVRSETITHSGPPVTTVPGGHGWLTVRTTPWSDVYFGARRLGSSPLAEVELPAGAHTLTFRNPKLGAITHTVTIRDGETTKLSLVLR